MPEAYNSIHTGEQIDEGISVILNNDIPGLANEAKKFADESKKSSEGSALSATQSAESATQSAESATQSAESATQSAESAITSKNFSKTSESFAKGETGTRPGEDTDNAKYYSELAAGSAAGKFGAMTFNGRSGNVLPEKGDYGEKQGIPTLDAESKIQKRFLPDIGTNIPRLSVPPTDPSINAYIDTAYENDPLGSSGSNQNLLINPWFQVLQTKKVFNEIADRWFGGFAGRPETTTGILGEKGIRFARPQLKEYMLTEVLVPTPRSNISFLTVSAQHTQYYTTSIKTSVFSFLYSTAPTFTVRSPIINGIQFQVRKEPYQYLDPTDSKLQYDKYLVYFRVAVEATVIHHVKLEFGNKSTISYDVQPTLAEDTLKCEAYKKVYSHNMFSGVITSPKTGLIELPLSTPLLNFPVVENFNTTTVYLSRGKKVPGSEITAPYSISEENKLMGSSSVIYPVEISPAAALSPSDNGPCIFFDTSVGLNTQLYPTRDEYNFPDDPT